MENLKRPAFSVDKSNILSTQEFQKMLNVWFEEKGIISDIRSELRLKMIHVLKNTAIGRDIGNRSYHRRSLYQQALDLIVAEYLIQNKFHYSLSIFNIEASLKNIFLEYSVTFQNMTPYDEFYFDDKEVLNILETIGIAKHSEYCEEIRSTYFKTEENKSILSSIISLLNNQICENNTYETIRNSEYIDMKKDDFLKQVGNILIQKKISTIKLKNIMENIEKLYNLEKETLEEKYSDLLNKLQFEIADKQKEIKELEEARRILEDAVLKMNKTYNKQKSHIKNLKEQLKLAKENITESKINRKDLPEKIYNNIKENSTSNISDVSKFQSKQVCQLKHCDNFCKETLNLTEKLAKENNGLKEEIEKQKEQNKKLHLKCKDLINEFSFCQNKINLLNSKIFEENSGGIVEDFPHDENFSPPQAYFPTNNVTSEISSDSITEEIIQQARLRLRKLEKETKEIEEKYKNLYSNL